MADVRLRYAQRHQCEMRCESLDQLLPPEHPARAVWQFVSRLDVSALEAKIHAKPHQPGAPAFDPRVLLALWLYATIDGLGSARELSELCQAHLAYRWLCGDLAINYHTLADFRTGHREFLNELLTTSVASLRQAGVVELNRVAQDGMKVRASAGQSSFRRPKRLAEFLAEAKAHVQALDRQSEDDAGAATRRQQAARERAAAERVERLEKAQSTLTKLQEENAARRRSKQTAPEELRASTTDADARRMKMADGGFRPAYNVQFATTTDSGVIVGVDVTDARTDAAQMPPLLDQVEQRCGVRPAEWLVDNGFADLDSIEAVEKKGTKVYAPVKEVEKKQQAGLDPFARRADDSDELAQWRARMGTEEAKTIYRQRAATAEWANAQARNRGLNHVCVRGRQKVLTVVLWYVLAHNFVRMLKLQAQATAAPTPKK